jgi:hypothetical protein
MVSSCCGSQVKCGPASGSAQLIPAMHAQCYHLQGTVHWQVPVLLVRVKLAVLQYTDHMVHIAAGVSGQQLHPPGERQLVLPTRGAASSRTVAPRTCRACWWLYDNLPCNQLPHGCQFGGCHLCLIRSTPLRLLCCHTCCKAILHYTKEWWAATLGLVLLPCCLTALKQFRLSLLERLLQSGVRAYTGGGVVVVILLSGGWSKGHKRDQKVVVYHCPALHFYAAASQNTYVFGFALLNQAPVLFCTFSHLCLPGQLLSLAPRCILLQPALTHCGFLCLPRPVACACSGGRRC